MLLVYSGYSGRFSLVQATKFSNNVYCRPFAGETVVYYYESILRNTPLLYQSMMSQFRTSFWIHNILQYYLKRRFEANAENLSCVVCTDRTTFLPGGYCTDS